MKFKIPNEEAVQRVRGMIKSYNLKQQEKSIKDSGYNFRRENKLFDAFTVQDIVFYFRDKSIESGKRYFISLEKDRAIISRLKNNGITTRELIDIIDFLFEGCDYIPFPTINVLGSRWINSLTIDATNWKLGKYIPRSISKKNEKLIEEKNYHTEEHKISISDW